MKKIYSLIALLVMAVSVSAQKYHPVNQASGEIQTGVDYVLYCSAATDNPYANATNGMGASLADDSYLWRFEEATGETSEEGYQLYVLYSVSRQAYWQEQDFEGNPGLDGYDIFDYAGINAEFGEKATAMRVTIIETNSTDDWRSETCTNSGFLIARNKVVPQDDGTDWHMSLSYQATDLAFAPWPGENYGWEIWSAEESTPQEQLQWLVERITNEGNIYKAGTEAGFYNPTVVEHYDNALKAAKEALAAGSASDDEYLAIYDELEAAEIAVKGAMNLFADGYYFIVSAGPFFNTQGVEKGVYASDATTPGWKTIDNCIEEKDYSFLWKLTEVGDNSYQLQNVLYGTYYAGPTTASQSVACVLNEAGNVTVRFEIVGNKGEWNTSETQWYIYDSFSNNKMFANNHGGGSGWVGNIVTWNSAAENSAAAWHVRPVTDEEYIYAVGKDPAYLELVASVRSLIQEAETLYDQLYQYSHIEAIHTALEAIKTEVASARQAIEEESVTEQTVANLQASIAAVQELYNNSGIEINEENFPDNAFRNWLSEQSYGEDGIITYREIGQITYIYIEEDFGITNLEGIQHFTALTDLACISNHLTSLNVSKNTALEYLSCSSNQLASLDVAGCTALTTLECSYNQLTSLDVTNNTALKYLYCNSNQLTSLDLSGCTALTALQCISNQLASLDLSYNTALASLYCSSNQLTSLDVSQNTALRTLHCERNQIYGEEMDKLIESLPNSNGSIYIFDGTSDIEGNICTWNQADAIKAKGWEPHCYDYSSPNFYSIYDGLTEWNVDMHEGQGEYWATLYAPFGYTLPEGAEAYIGTVNTNGTALDMTSIGQKVPRGVPVVIKGNSASVVAEVDDDITAEVGDNDLVGMYEPFDATGTGYYTLGIYEDIVGFYKYKGTVGRFKAVLELPEGIKANSLKVLFDNDDITAIEDANAIVDNANAVYYDLQGRRVAEPQKGQLYIVNGKTIVFQP